MTPRITFLGAAQTVTGSRHLLEIDGKRILVDAGLFQGPRALREKNWQPFPVDPQDLDAIVVTHAHTDHIGYLPRLVRQGYRGPIYATPGTLGIARISLPDGGRIQEEDARYANKHRLSRHDPAEPLYTEADAYACLKQFETVRYRTLHRLPGGAQFQFFPAGHILGSAFAEIYFPSGERILMSGDLGRYDTPIITDPTPMDFAEYLVLESTYGDRLHGDEVASDRLAELLTAAYHDSRVVLVPSFAIGRTQELLYLLSGLQREGRIPRIPIFVDSPMATTATQLYDRTVEDHDVDMRNLEEVDGKSPLQPDHLEFVRDTNASKALNRRPGPMVIISGSGMLTGGRVVHHLKQRLSDPKTLLLFTGYQGQGTMGRDLLDGAEEVTIHGQPIEVRAHIERLTSLSAHADYSEILTWLSHFTQPPKRTFLVHGEPEAQESLRDKIVAQYGWDVAIPHEGQTFRLGEG